MRDTPMLSVTKVVDDSPDAWRVREVEFSIHLGPLMSFLERYGEPGAAEIKDVLELLKGKVDDYLSEVER